MNTSTANKLITNRDKRVAHASGFCWVPTATEEALVTIILDLRNEVAELSARIAQLEHK
jgi:hypothetical protein